MVITADRVVVGQGCWGVRKLVVNGSIPLRQNVYVSTAKRIFGSFRILFSFVFFAKFFIFSARRQPKSTPKWGISRKRRLYSESVLENINAESEKILFPLVISGVKLK